MEKFLLTEDFKKRIKARRMELGATQKEVARYFHVTVGTYWYWENGCTQRCNTVSHSRLLHFVESDMSLIRQEMSGKVMNKNDYETLDGCLRVVAQVCDMVHENDEIFNEYSRNVHKILMDAVKRHLSVVEGCV